MTQSIFFCRRCGRERWTPPTWRAVVGRAVGRAPEHGRPAVDHVDSAPLLQLLAAPLQRFDEILLRLHPDHAGLRRTMTGAW